MWRTPFFFVTVFLLAVLSLVIAQSRGDYPTSSAVVTQKSWRPLFTVPATADHGRNMLANIDDPMAVDPQVSCPGYKAGNVQRNANGFTATLTLAGKACNVYGTDIQSLNLSIEHQAKDRLHVEIIPTVLDASNISQFILSPHLVDAPEVDHSGWHGSDLVIDWGNEPSFYFTVSRASTQDTLFSTKGSKLVFENQFLEFKSPLPENYNLYGLGEAIHGLRLGNNLTRTIYAADVGDPIDRYYEVDGSNGKLTPFSGNSPDRLKSYTSISHGVYLRNAHGQEVLLRPEGITWRTIGGSIDLYFYAGPSQVEVTKSFQLTATGLPAMQQYWTFGFHQCRWGYRNWSEVENVVLNYEKFGIPLEAIWIDIDYMELYRDFTVDHVAFPADVGRSFLQRLHDGGRYLVPIIDSAIYSPNPENASDAYDVYTRGEAQGVFMTNPDGSLYVGAVWPGYTVFPDWLSKNAAQWWVDSITAWHKEIPFDGIWIDMNEVSSFCIGSCGSKNLTLNPVHPPFVLPGEPGNIPYDYPEGFSVTNATEAASASAASSSQAAAATSPAAASSTTVSYYRPEVTLGARDTNYPPYVINNVQDGHDLASHAVSPNATHADGTQEYDVHNLFGHLILNATYHGLTSVFPEKRPFIIGRSTFVGSGKWAGHWGGDNFSKWAYMFFSIPQALSFSLFGIPMFGVDTCGFSGNADEELCNRWMQLSAFFTFYRNHNVIGTIPQEAYVWASVAKAAKDAMYIRFQLLPYIYTLMYQAHTTGSTVMRALAWEFPDDPSLASADRQFLLGASIMVTPVLSQGATTVDGVFPGAGDGTVWYDWYTGALVEATAGQNMTIDAPLGHIPIYIRGGSVLPLQEPAMTTTQARKNPWGILAALGSDGKAIGSLYVDDGESVVPDTMLWVEASASNSTLSASAQGQFRDTNVLANITILGVLPEVTKVSLNGVDLPNDWAYDGSSKALEIKGLDKAMAGGAWSQDWVLTWG
ncbi:hypothetical protein FGG08_002964 [Glutinoglossum americanum]|uniref:alpha-glucosidase n=1 Tax=Glutinoglossum americanum TaxID=1670608 RepID=A0A9P8IE62_9PEZI|nr:hypothetical protein FGG08_002964 [Glutinoglossum americanum]